MDAVGSERATLYGWSEGGPMCLMFCATYPERVSSLVLYGTYASTRILRGPKADEEFERKIAIWTDHWAKDTARIQCPEPGQ